MSRPMVIIPARVGSKGIPGKNFKPLNGAHPMGRALDCGKLAGCLPVITSDHLDIEVFHAPPHQYAFKRPPELAQDDTPMIDVVRHVLEQIPGPPDQPIVLLQPTQPLREPKHITQALALLTPEVDSVVSVVEIPQTHAASNHAYIDQEAYGGLLVQPWAVFGDKRRQDCGHTYIRDGTCYVFWRRTVTKHGNIYGELVRPLIIPAQETCALDDMEDWYRAERLLREREEKAHTPRRSESETNSR